MLSANRLRVGALIAGLSIALIGLGAVVAAVDAERELTSIPSGIGSIDDPTDRAFDAQLGKNQDDLRAWHEMQARLGVAGSGPASQPVRAGAPWDLEHRQVRPGAQPRVAAADATSEAAAPARALGGIDLWRLLSASLLVREATRSAAPFDLELRELSTLTTDLAPTGLTLDHAEVIEQITRLQPYAGTGMATRSDLRRSFVTVAAAIDRAQGLPWWESLLVLIGWREDPLAPVRKAETALLYDDLSGAVDSLATLTGAPAAAAEGWLTLARARLAIDNATAGLYRSILEAGARVGPGDALASVRAAASREFK